ncbi:uncharacterized protein LOC141668539 isoform X4 [Apium graveolens]|uniref:uncharacterized protein LOC141668539 isoform X4 n=1 Tax=Apium graveolens TaxID=4045 RepID=UPI003D7B72BC
MTLSLSSSPLTIPSPSHSRKTWAAAGAGACMRRRISKSCSCSASSPRPAVILPGLGNNTNDYQQLVLTLQDYAIPTVVANVARIDWLRNAAGLLDPNYWSGTLQPRPILDWVDEAINEAKELAQGGWLARVYLEEYGSSDVSLLLTLGSPLLPPPKGISGVIDQTRGLLNYVEDNCAKAVYTPELRYVCVAGRYIQGARFYGTDDTNSLSSIPVPVQQPASEVLIETGTSLTATSSGATFRARFVGQGYKQVCGKADVWGDGVVPEVSAHLEGALNISLDGVYHSPVGSDDESRPWYGSPSVVDKWINHLLH